MQPLGLNEIETSERKSAKKVSFDGKKPGSSGSEFIINIRSDQLELYGADAIASAPARPSEAPKSTRSVLAISADQMQSLAVVEERKLVERMTGMILREHTDLAGDLTSRQLMDFVNEVFTRVRSNYGFVLERDVFQYVLLSLALGDGFETLPVFGWAAEFLRDKDLEPGVRVVKVRDGLRAGRASTAGGETRNGGSDG